jgi:putative oxidoreductase
MTKGVRARGVSFTGAGLLTLRLVIGFVFVMHGGQKLFVTGLPAVAGALADFGITPPHFWAVVLTWAELVGGLSLIAGLVARLAAVTLAVTMLVAIASVLWAKGFFLPGYEFELTLLGSTVALALTGPGCLAVDRWLGFED